MVFGFFAPPPPVSLGGAIVAGRSGGGRRAAIRRRSRLHLRRFFGMPNFGIIGYAFFMLLSHLRHHFESGNDLLELGF